MKVLASRMMQDAVVRDQRMADRDAAAVAALGEMQHGRRNSRAYSL